tara:strand:- start:1186 stop:1419 length:234 start_codon:yes stop_codon:yes gene_type:complete
MYAYTGRQLTIILTNPAAVYPVVNRAPPTTFEVSTGNLKIQLKWRTKPKAMRANPVNDYSDMIVDHCSITHNRPGWQ